MGYRITGEKCGSIRFEPDTGTINKEGITMSSKMTENAIEDGSSINDHVIKSSEQFPIGGILVGGNADADRLTRMWKERVCLPILAVCGGNNLIITNLSITSEHKNAGGCSFTATPSESQYYYKRIYRDGGNSDEPG